MASYIARATQAIVFFFMFVLVRSSRLAICFKELTISDPMPCRTLTLKAVCLSCLHAVMITAESIHNSPSVLDLDVRLEQMCKDLL